eukprot:m.483238 g.483238  ORF g.483238 m.483238 type:complete len:252 (-) comp22846_c0_seq1:152-907(-)
MTLKTLFGCLFLAFSGPFAAFFFTARKSPRLVVMCVSSMFCWLLSIVASAIVWNIIQPLKDEPWFAVAVSVPIQELFRYLFWRLLRKAEKGLNTLGDDGSGVKITRDKIAFVSGIGFALMSAGIQFNIPLENSGGPGTLPSPGCESHSYFVILALVVQNFGFLHMFWSVIMHGALEARNSPDAAKSGWFVFSEDWKVAFVVLGHLGASLLTLNNDQGGACGGTLAPLYILTVVTGALAWQSARLKLGKPEN